MLGHEMATITLVAFLVTALDESLVLCALFLFGLLDAVQAHASIMLDIVTNIIQCSRPHIAFQTFWSRHLLFKAKVLKGLALSCVF